MTIERIDLGSRVICDDCGDEYTDRADTGGILFGSKATCPTCAPHVEALAKQYGETDRIRARCPAGMEFRTWVLWLRAGNNTIKIYTGDDARDALDWPKGGPE